MLSWEEAGFCRQCVRALTRLIRTCWSVFGTGPSCITRPTWALPIAYAMAQEAGVKAYIYDAVAVDEMEEIYRITGIRNIRRVGRGHNLNMRGRRPFSVRGEGRRLPGEEHHQRPSGRRDLHRHL